MPYQQTVRGAHELAYWQRSDYDEDRVEKPGRIKDGWACALLAVLAIAVGWLVFSQISWQETTVSATSIKSR